MTNEHAEEEVPADGGRHLPIRREEVAPPRRGATSPLGRRRLFTVVVLAWVVVVITVPALALRSSSSSSDSAPKARTLTLGPDKWRNEPYTESPPVSAQPTTTLPDPATYARLGLPVPSFFVPPPQVIPLTSNQATSTPGVDSPWETSPTTEVPPVTAPPVQVLNQIVGVDVSRTDTSSTSTIDDRADLNH